MVRHCFGGVISTNLHSTAFTTWIGFTQQVISFNRPSVSVPSHIYELLVLIVADFDAVVK